MVIFFFFISHQFYVDMKQTIFVFKIVRTMTNSTEISSTNTNPPVNLTSVQGNGSDVSLHPVIQYLMP